MLRKGIRWSAQKDFALRRDPSRLGIGLAECAEAIREGRLLDQLESTNYPGQKIAVVEHNGYAFAVPYVENDEEIFLKTAFPSRKLTRKYLRN
ncbi:MAG: toxin [Roseitalea porphyridii]|jgi:hypothetical protein|uniref:toxin n=1 Tax=Roseitalea porphyridii TaxID=1852022 RepID=UPI0032EE1B8C